MEIIPFSAWIAFAALLVTIFIASGGIIWTLVWKLSDIQDKASIYIDIKYKSFEDIQEKRISTLRTELLNADGNTMRSASEVGFAVTTKVQQFELWVRDELKLFVLKEDFRDDLRVISNIVDTLGSRIEKRLESFEEKLDKLQQFNMEALRRKGV